MLCFWVQLSFYIKAVSKLEIPVYANSGSLSYLQKEKCPNCTLQKALKERCILSDSLQAIINQTHKVFVPFIQMSKSLCNFRFLKSTAAHCTNSRSLSRLCISLHKVGFNIFRLDSYEIAVLL